MAKRTATSELNDRNWDQEVEEEKAGEFSVASDDAMKSRPILKARRKIPPALSGAKPAFTGFGGFSFKPTQTSTPLPVFGGFTKTESKIPSDKTEVPGRTETESENSKSQNGSTDTTERTTYLSSLKSLNQSVSQWIKQHVEKNPYCILTPIFKDYEKHLNELDKGKDKEEPNRNSDKSPQEKPKVEDSEKPELPKTGLTFGLGALTAANSIGAFNPAQFTGFSFGTAKTTTSDTGSGFSFAVGSSAQAKPLATVTEAAGDEEYEPPKPEVKEVEEEGALYTKKCKLFYQKDGAWMDRGVGHLHLKKIDDDKSQLLVRADTSLGNILLNIMLTTSIPATRQGKNNVSLVCIPNPPVDPKAKDSGPVPMLIRVKSGEDADELLKQINILKG